MKLIMVGNFTINAETIVYTNLIGSDVTVFFVNGSDICFHGSDATFFLERLRELS